ncbi:MAG: 30S ribosomal protein S20 [Patescibacteria group bacterium]
MPLLKHAKKKLRQDKGRTLQNKKLKEAFKKLVKAARTETSAETVSKAFSGIDKAAQQNIIHENKAARIKSSLTKQLSNPTEKKAAPAKSKKVTKATKAKKK